MTITIKYVSLESFEKNFKRLTKKFKTLPEDLVVAKRNAIELFHVNNIDNQSIVLISRYSQEHTSIYKLRKFACKSLKGRGVKSGIRIIYAFEPLVFRVTLIEIYFKPDQENEDKQLIEDFISCHIQPIV